MPLAVGEGLERGNKREIAGAELRVDAGVPLVVEGDGKAVEGGGIESASGHFEEDVVFLPDVVAKQAGILRGEFAQAGDGIRVAGPGRGEVFADAGETFAAEGMFMEHHADGATLDGDAAFGESREEGFLFLVVVAAVGEMDEEIERLCDEIGGKRSRRRRGQPGVEGMEDFLDEAVFVHQVEDGVIDGHGWNLRLGVGRGDRGRTGRRRR